jgi:hypothetical protein
VPTQDRFAHVEEPSQEVIGIETDRGLWVQSLA